MLKSVNIVKRLVDVAASAVGLTVAAPVFPLIAIAIRLDSKGPIFYKQVRAGQLLGGDPRNGFEFQKFEMFKFRSMRTDAEKGTGAQFAAQNDPRVTRVGKFLRASRLDELPQLLNVLKGDMSLVGPRPERPELLAHLALAIPFFEERMRGVKPGITGLAQISLGYTGKPHEGSELAPYLKDMVNPFAMEEAEGADADDLRIKILYDFAYSAALEKFATFFATELRVIVMTPLTMLKLVGR